MVEMKHFDLSGIRKRFPAAALSVASVLETCLSADCIAEHVVMSKSETAGGGLGLPETLCSIIHN